jgi:hypothetical protein
VKEFPLVRQNHATTNAVARYPIPLPNSKIPSLRLAHGDTETIGDGKADEMQKTIAAFKRDNRSKIASRFTKVLRFKILSKTKG